MRTLSSKLIYPLLLMPNITISVHILHTGATNLGNTRLSGEYNQFLLKRTFWTKTDRH